VTPGRIEPFEPCVGCGRGDTPIAWPIEGDFDFHVRVHAFVFQNTVEEATDYVERWIDRTFEEAPDGEFVEQVRLCPECTAWLRMPVRPDDDHSLAGFRQGDVEGAIGDEPGEWA
jgi:hypothetical protein